MLAPSDMEAQAVFVERFMPEIKSRAAMLLADHPAEAREEGTEEILAQSWQGFLSAWRRGKAWRVTPYTLTSFAHRHYRAGRRIGGSGRNDAMAERTRIAGNTRMVSIEGPPIRRMCENPGESVRWQLDLAAVIQSLPKRQRMVLALLALGWRTGEIAAQLGVSPSRVVQIIDQIGFAFRLAGYGST